MKLLLFSNSTNSGEPYLQFTLPFIKGFLGGQRKKGLFIPYAAVTFSYDEYENRVKERFASIGHKIESVHHFENKIEVVENADLIIIGGGNSFCLLKNLYDNNLIEPIRSKVLSGTPYIGWSAGSNVACPGLYTTNDMPIVEPLSFKSLNFVDYQINPHYTDVHPEGHAGETREIRIKEFCTANKSLKVLGLPEGTVVKVEAGKSLLMGSKPAYIFSFDEGRKILKPGDLINL
jgi:dipeptidase E